MSRDSPLLELESYVDKLNANILQNSMEIKKLQNKLLISGIFGEVTTCNPNDDFQIRNFEKDKLFKDIKEQIFNQDNTQLNNVIEELEKEVSLLTNLLLANKEYTEALEEKILFQHEDLNQKEEQINSLNNVSQTSSELIEGLEKKVIESNQMIQTLKKEMQTLIYKTQIAYVEIDKKNDMVMWMTNLSIVLFVFLLTVLAVR
jgi:chromosome segregation ATPase